jgi:hypothetical protein
MSALGNYWNIQQIISVAAVDERGAAIIDRSCDKCNKKGPAPK